MLTKYTNERHVYFWPNRSVCIGPSSSIAPRLYGTVALHVGVYTPFQISVNRQPPIICRCAVVPANTPHTVIFSGGIHAKLFIERDCPDYLHFITRFPFNPQWVMPFQDQEAIACFRWIYEAHPHAEVIRQQLDLLLQCDKPVIYTLDTRIQTILALLDAEPDVNFSQEKLANRVNLSVSRFLHLFKAQVHVPYRRFRNWRRLILAMKNLNTVDNINTFANSGRWHTPVCHCKYPFFLTI